MMEHKKNILLLMLSFILPGVIILGALAGLHVTPFGNISLAISDGDALYLNYMGYISKVLHGEEGITYSFTKGLGGNMMGSWAWFLLNPVFALFALTDITNYVHMFTYVSIISFCLCGLTMYICLKDFYGHKADNLIFSTAYAMNGFLVANVFQLNFFVVIPVLPIMVMGLRRVLKGDSPVVYLFSIAYALFANFYFGFMLCVASLLIFVIFIVFFYDRIENKKAIVLRYVSSSVLGGAMSSVVWLPALVSLKGGRLDQSVVDKISLKENMPFLDIFSKLFIGANSTSELSNGLPNIFVGIFPVFLVILFFLSRDISAQKKRAAAVLLVFYLLTFYVVVFNMVMHGGTVTNWFNYRDSFVFCFLMIMIAAEEWQHFADEPWNNVKHSLAILTVSTILILSKEYEYVSGGLVVAGFAILALILGAFWMHKKDSQKNPLRVLTMVTLVMVCLDMYLNYYFSVKNILDWSNPLSEYQDVTIPVSALVNGVQKSDDSFYRMEIGEQRSGDLGNDPMLYGYYGVGHGGSDDRDFVRLALSELGVHRFNMRNSYGRGVTAATDNLLGIRYVISKDNLTTEKGYENLISIGKYSIYRNQNALPIAMVVNEDVEDVTLDIEDIFDNLNRTWSAISGVSNKIFVEEENVTYSIHNITDPVTMSSKEAKEIVSVRDAKLESENSGIDFGEAGDNDDSSASDESRKGEVKEAWATQQEKPVNTNYIGFTFTASRDGAVYTYNRSGMIKNNGADPHAINYEGYYHKGDKVTGYIIVNTSLITEYLLEEVAGRMKVVYLDSDVLADMSETLLERPSSVEKTGKICIQGSFSLKEGQKVMFTIPYDEGWTLFIDGNKKEIKKVLDVFMAADAEPGEHTYEMRFKPQGLTIGEIIAVISVFLTMIYVFRIMKKGLN